MFDQRWGRRVRETVSLILIGVAWFKFQADFNYGLRGDGQQLRWSNSSFLPERGDPAPAAAFA